MFTETTMLCLLAGVVDLVNQSGNDYMTITLNVR